MKLASSKVQVTTPKKKYFSGTLLRKKTPKKYFSGILSKKTTLPLREQFCPCLGRDMLSSKRPAKNDQNDDDDDDDNNNNSNSNNNSNNSNKSHGPNSLPGKPTCASSVKAISSNKLLLR
ncbi:unnamed protein product [Polarella glacialis]|uniref:Uncharacterized protein n=1 Tax=Polarella glacialis TaxID=89957 RepID=A0A813FM30_POLGL|nr:unnamed protein product [Polarella glacialis]